MDEEMALTAVASIEKERVDLVLRQGQLNEQISTLSAEMAWTDESKEQSDSEHIHLYMNEMWACIQDLKRLEHTLETLPEGVDNPVVGDDELLSTIN